MHFCSDAPVSKDKTLSSGMAVNLLVLMKNGIVPPREWSLRSSWNGRTIVRSTDRLLRNFDEAVN